MGQGPRSHRRLVLLVTGDIFQILVCCCFVLLLLSCVIVCFSKTFVSTYGHAMTEKGQMAQSREGECVADYELQRNARVQENKKRMLELGLTNLSETLAKDGRSMGLTNGVVRSNAKTAPRLPTPHLLSSPTPTRRSSRLQSTPALCYKELSEKDICSGSISNSGGYPHLQPEYYTKEHEVLLGSYNAEWELFKDGYGSDGVRIYDSVRGKTCHQCRQKTLGLRTWCNNCESLQGQFCGDCLIMRYGENLLEVNQKKNWKCPSCRGICNCSICRIRKGWSPTGSLYKKVYIQPLLLADLFPANGLNGLGVLVNKCCNVEQQ
ncbi:hypothetical protein O6H91_03G090000 [Diphasiastrum complanatum]|uniref:Uncharacterized protein n=1 Tax=Diphasiastrum complanatum TaxID=34168 RepID=A0ACC2E8W1_DIPCM|nr:hypothetical protein O6H91_03G090000 [Diphasiastrum complanatum]